MTYELTQHARDAMEEREIATEWLEAYWQTPRLSSQTKSITDFSTISKPLQSTGIVFCALSLTQGLPSCVSSPYTLTVK